MVPLARARLSSRLLRGSHARCLSSGYNIRCAKQPPIPLSFGAVVAATACLHAYYSYTEVQATLCESTDPSGHEGHSSDVDEEMIGAYVQSLMKNQEMIRLPFGFKSAPFLLDALEFHKILVKEAICCFECTVDAWNHPQDQAMLAGHPIAYTKARRHDRCVRYHLIHNPNVSVPYEVLELVADTLLEEPKMTAYHTLPMRCLPHSFKRRVITNMLHVVTSILVDLMLSFSVHSGAFEMQWTVHPKKAEAYYQSLRNKATIQARIREALEQVDLDVIEELAAETLANSGPANSYLFSLVGQNLYAAAFKSMLIVFYMFNWDTEGRMMGRTVQQKFVKPIKKEPTSN